MAAKPSLSEIDTQIERLRERKRLLIVKSAERFARAATKSGLAEMEITDDEVERIFGEIAARFRKGESKAVGGAPHQTRRTTDTMAEAPSEVRRVS